MRLPDPPPVLTSVAHPRLVELLLAARDPTGYPHWDDLRRQAPPEGISHEEWWLATKIRRSATRRFTGLEDPDGRPFTYTLPDQVLREIEFVASTGSGQISLSEEVANPATRDRYLVNSLIEESIRSSQLEGAATTRLVAKDMIRSGRLPRDRSERMIANNFAAMRFIGDLRHDPLTPELICEIQRIVTAGTLDDPDTAGRFQRADEDRVGVYASDDVLYEPPPAALLPARIEALCAFANAPADAGPSYLPPVLRAITLHFMLGYEHPFVDGNGRTARALFYWSMLRHGYWLTEFLSISRVLRRSPTGYATAYLHTETDENDLTYFFLHQLAVLHEAFDGLTVYLERKIHEVRAMREQIGSAADEELNHRQLALLRHAMSHRQGQYTVSSHRAAHRVVTETARQDLVGLETLGLLVKRKIGKRYVFAPGPDIDGRLDALQQAR